MFDSLARACPALDNMIKNINVKIKTNLQRLFTNKAARKSAEPIKYGMK